jgi:hypothetical protein
MTDLLLAVHCLPATAIAPAEGAEEADQPHELSSSWPPALSSSNETKLR